MIDVALKFWVSNQCMSLFMFTLLVQESEGYDFLGKDPKILGTVYLITCMCIRNFSIVPSTIMCKNY